MSFTDGKPRIATEADVKARWCCGKPGEYFRCGFCWYTFQVGDYWRFFYTNDTPGYGGNPLVCKNCDRPRDELLQIWKEHYAEATEAGRYRQEGDPSVDAS